VVDVNIIYPSKLTLKPFGLKKSS